MLKMPDTTFCIHPQLQKDSALVGYFQLCQLRMINDSQYPWFILLPQRGNVSEIYQLEALDQMQLQQESCFLAAQLAALFKADKMNIAAIGNIVPQLHLHHIVRYQHDKAWPSPVWGKFAMQPYTELNLAERITQITDYLGANLSH